MKLKNGVIVIVLVFTTITKMYGQNFSVVKIPVDRMKSLNFYEENKCNHFYKIVFNGDTSDGAISSYNRIMEKIKNSNIDKIALIKELMKFKGDKRLCCIPIKHYNLDVSQGLEKDISYYSIQIEALFIINQLYFPKPFNYSPFPVLYNSYFKKIIAVKGWGIHKVFARYEQWLLEIEKTGIEEAISKHKDPLDKSNISWYSGVYPWNLN